VSSGGIPQVRGVPVDAGSGNGVSEAGDALLAGVTWSVRSLPLGERLAGHAVVADVFVVGDAAMVLAYDATSVTQDVDTRFVPHKPDQVNTSGGSTSGVLRITVLRHGGISPGSQTGSQRRQAARHACSRSETVTAARWDISGRRKTSEHGSGAPYKRGVTGSIPVAPTSGKV
jgi:hypothetical protein